MAEAHDRPAAPVHPLARAFDTAGDAYERGRPGYPADAVAALLAAVGPERPILDLAAGTGKLTRQLWHAGAVVAVEPSEGMRSKLLAHVEAASSRPDVQVLAGTAEAIPLPNHSVGAVVVGQAFHWFRGEEALAEIHRVLRPGGRLAIVWNNRDETVDWVARFSTIVDAHGHIAPNQDTEDWRKAFADTELFGPLREQRFRHEHVLGGVEALLDRAASISYIAALGEAARAEVLQELRELCATHPALRDAPEIRMPYETVLHVSDALDDGGY